MIDALNAKHLGIYGYQRQTSPNLDKLAQQGLALSNFVSNSSWTRPSFATIITGLPKSEHGVELANRDIEMKLTTLAERFRVAGFRTAGFVGNPLVREIWGFGQGFQVYEDTESLGRIFPADQVLIDKAIAWLERIGNEPFFLLLFLTAPHAPYRPPREHFLAALPPGKTIEYPFREYTEPLTEPAHARVVAAYDDEIRYADQQVGRLVGYLRKTKKLSHTSIVVTADHGEALGDHNCYTHTYHMWESVLRVPFILVSPSIQKKGVHNDQPFTHLDIVPTLLQLAGIASSADGLPGRSVLESLTQPTPRGQRTLFSQYNAHGIRRQALRRGRWKLIHHHQVADRALKNLNSLERHIPHADPQELPSLARDKERYELYDLAADPQELNDLFSAKREAKELGELLDALRPHLGEEEQPGQLSQELIEALENAGYLKPATKSGSEDRK